MASSSMSHRAIHVLATLPRFMRRHDGLKVTPGTTGQVAAGSIRRSDQQCRHYRLLNDQNCDTPDTLISAL